MSWGHPIKSIALCSVLASANLCAAGFYVSTQGRDTWSGTLPDPNASGTDGPFATFRHARDAMRNSSTKTTYVRAGTYFPPPDDFNGDCLYHQILGDGSEVGGSQNVQLTSADNGETWSYYPPDGVDTAILDGGSPAIPQSGDGGYNLGSGNGCAFTTNQASNITINGLQFQHYKFSAVSDAGGSSNLTVINNEIHDLRVAAFGADGISVTCSQGAQIKNNYIHDVPYMGIAVGAAENCPGGISNTLISGNYIQNSCTWAAHPNGNDQDGGDCGAIYLEDRVETVSASTNIRILNNYTRDVNASSNGGGDFPNQYIGAVTCGIYLDEGASNVTVTGNIMTGIQGECAMIHGGSNDNFKNNVCDIGRVPLPLIMDYAHVNCDPTVQHCNVYPMTGNIFQNNIVVSGGGAGMGYWGDSPGAPMVVQNNAYFNYAGTSVNSTAVGNTDSDSNPTYVNPGLSCWTPTIASGNSVFNGPVSFPGITGGWGPPGFVIPQTGTAPSWPTACSGGTNAPPITINVMTPGTLSAQPGQTINFTTHWAGGPTTNADAIFVHFVNADGTGTDPAFQDPDHDPTPPTTQWSGTFSEVRNGTFTIPPTIPAGTYRILAGLFLGNTRETLTPGVGVTDNGDQRYQIGTLTVVTAAPLPPTIATPAAASPSPVTGTTATLSVLGADDGGESALTYTWATTGTPPASVSFSANGTNAAKNVTATFAKAGSYSVQATIKNAGNLTVASSVNVAVNQTVTTVAVSPASAQVTVNGTGIFSAIVKDQFNAPITPSPMLTWSVTGGGSIGGAGLFTAGNAAGGPFTVRATAGGPSGSAQVTVTASTGNPTIPLPPLSLSGVDGKTFMVNDAISFNYAATGATFAWDFEPVALAAVGNGDLSPAQTTSAPRFTPASAGIGPGAYRLTITATQGAQSQSAQATVTLVGADLSTMKVRPNPWRSDKHAGKGITFDGLTMGTTIKIFTISGHKVKEWATDGPSSGWDLTNASGDKVGSGIYLYLVTDDQGDSVKGKLAIVK